MGPGALGRTLVGRIGGVDCTLTVDSWTCNTIRFRFPTTAPAGQYELFIRNGSTVVSNGLPIAAS